jgi:hypothetical protein
MMVPRALATRAPYLDVTAAMNDQATSRAVTLKVIPPVDARFTEAPSDDPFDGVEV